MAALTFLHFGVHSKLRRLPSFRGLVNLRSLKLAIMLALEEIPEFTDLTELKRLVLPFLPRVDLILDMAPIPNLLEFVILHRGRVCCDGFLDPSDCNLSRSTCYEHPLRRDLPIACLPKNRTDLLATEATRRMFTKFPYLVCAASLEILVKENEYLEQDEIGKCQGVMYRQCATRTSNSTDMCFNLCRMAIASTDDVNRIALRKRQIAE